MKHRFVTLSNILSLAVACFFLTSFLQQSANEQPPSTLRFPYKEAGLTERQAAAHLLNRFSFGANPGQVDEVVRTGLEKWFMQQMNGGIADDSLQARLKEYDALNLSNTEVNEIYPRPIQILKMAREEGIIPKDSAKDADRKQYKKEIAQYVKQKNFRRQSALFRQFISAKIERAAYSRNQLQEVLTDFWFNHFNVSLTKKDCALFIPAYERDAIRPNVTGRFEDLLLATAKSSAMLLYLDNFTSAATADDVPSANKERMRRSIQQINPSIGDSTSYEMLQKLKKRKNNQGLNENYAREVMELHTMGVDGGYTQTDVTQAARILTGWTLYPMDNSYGGGIAKMIAKIGEDKLSDHGFVREGDFLFAMNRHDNKEKVVMGKTFPANGGYQEGVLLLKMLAHLPSTATFICRKIAVHFVSDNPPQSLVDKMAKTFLNKGGEIKEVLITMATAPEFWKKEVMREKIKSPFELAISAVRALDADIEQPYQLFNWIDKMGQKIYYYQAPTGFPDRAQYWINTGALLNRMNFGLSIASQKMRGIKTDLLALNNYHEPESPADALLIYGKLLLPERDLDATIKRITALLTAPSLEKKLEAAADKTGTVKRMDDDKKEEEIVDEAMKANEENTKSLKVRKTSKDNEGMLAQVVGIIIGSPEFQRK